MLELKTTCKLYSKSSTVMLASNIQLVMSHYRKYLFGWWMRIGFVEVGGDLWRPDGVWVW